MKTIFFTFTNPYDDLDYKKRNNIKIEDSGALYNDGEHFVYSSRRRVIDVVRSAYRSGNLLSGKKVVTSDMIEYTYIICIGKDNDKEVKGKIVVNIPTSLALIDSEVYGQTKVLDMYEGRAIRIRKQRGLAIALLSGAAFVVMIGGAMTFLDGATKEEQERVRRDKEYRDEFERNQRSQSRQDIANGYHSEQYSISPATYYVPHTTYEYATEETTENVKVKTLK